MADDISLMDDDEGDTMVSVGGGAQGGAEREDRDTGRQGGSNQQPAGDDAEYEIIEDNGTYQDNEARLSEDEGGDGTLLGQRQAAADQGSRTRASRRQREKDARRQRDRENALLTQEVAELRSRLDGMAPRLDQFSQQQIQSTIQDLDRQIAQHAHDTSTLARQMADAMANGDSDSYVAAMTRRDDALVGGLRLQAQKRQLEGTIAQQRAMVEGEQAQQQRVQQQPRQDPGVVLRTNEFRQDNPWFDPRSPNARDRADTAAAQQIDREVAAMGYRPNTDDYWDALDLRLRDALPHRYADEVQQQPRDQGRQTQARQQQPASAVQQRRGPMTAGSGGGGAPGKIRVAISPDRKKAMISAGALDSDGRITDRTKYTRLVKSYSEFDRDNGVGRQ